MNILRLTRYFSIFYSLIMPHACSKACEYNILPKTNLISLSSLLSRSDHEKFVWREGFNADALLSSRKSLPSSASSLYSQTRPSHFASTCRRLFQKRERNDQEERPGGSNPTEAHRSQRQTDAACGHRNPEGQPQQVCIQPCKPTFSSERREWQYREEGISRFRPKLDWTGVQLKSCEGRVQ